jgi:hypothetical protein
VVSIDRCRISNCNVAGFTRGAQRVAKDPNEVDFEYMEDFGTGPQTYSGLYGQVERTSLHVDVGAGYWLIRRPEARFFTGLAFVAEPHYTDAMQPAPSDGDRSRSDLLDLTLGLHGEFHNPLCRVGGAFQFRPAEPNETGVVSSEVLVQLERRF